MAADNSGLLGDTPCIHCGYFLRTLSRDGRCPECGQPVADSLYTLDEAQIIAREQRILARMDAYRRNRNGAVWLAGFSAVGTALLLISVWVLPSTVKAPEFAALITSGVYSAAFWAAVAFANRYRFEHAQSIERFRFRERLRDHEGKAAEAMDSTSRHGSDNE